VSISSTATFRYRHFIPSLTQQKGFVMKKLGYGLLLAGLVSLLIFGIASAAGHWESIHVLNANGTPYQPAPQTDLLIFRVGDASWVDGKSLAEAVASNQLVFDPGVLFLEDGSRGPGIGTAGFQGPKDGGYYAMAIAAPGKPVKYLGTVYLPPAGAKRELHCTMFKLGTWGGYTCPY
jgi:hypothetical protein